MRVTLSDIYKSFGNVEVVKGLDLEISEGEFLVLLGPSGCGKTTALRMVAGLESVTSGKISIGDRDVTEVLPKYRDVAMVFQSYALYPHMTVAANIGYPLKLRKVPKAEQATQIREAAEKVHLEDYLDRFPRQLSGGQRQRVALARAIVRRPSVFLMDEPLSNLDAKLRSFMRAELKHLQSELNTTTIYVTHDQIEAMTLAHRVAVMNKGVVQQIATPREIYDNPANLFVAGFIGSPPMNTLHGSIADGAFVGPEGKVALAGYAPRDKVVFGFRPEDARVVDPATSDIRAKIYACELTGNETIVTCQMGKSQIVVKMDKNFDMPPNAPVALSIDEEKICLFDADSGDKIAKGG
ncbi:MAG: ABC transporter ATP-binding protein [Bauldia litoralis]